MAQSWLVQSLQSVIADLNDECAGSGIALDTTEGYRWRIELVYRDLLAKECLNREINNAEKIALDCLAKVYNEMSMYIDRLLIHPEDVIPAQQAQVVLTGAVGRPSLGISHHQLNYGAHWCSRKA